MRKTLLNDQLEEEFQRNGYVSIPFLSKDEVEELKDYFFKTIEESAGRLAPEDEEHSSSAEITYDFTFLDKNIDYKRQVFNKITKAFEDRYSKYLADYKPIIANFIRKEQDAGEVPMHQNWAFVDEHRCASVSIWCPLVDSNAENGTLEVVPGSHKRFGEIRGPMIESELININDEVISKHMVPIETKAGDAVVLDDSIVHYSSPNNTDGLRLAIQLILIPKEENSIHFHMDLSKDREQVETLEVDHEFYMIFNPWKKPSESIKRLSSFKYKPTKITLAEFEQRLAGSRFDKADKKTFWNYFKRSTVKV